MCIQGCAWHMLAMHLGHFTCCHGESLAWDVPYECLWNGTWLATPNYSLQTSLAFLDIIFQDSAFCLILYFTRSIWATFAGIEEKGSSNPQQGCHIQSLQVLVCYKILVSQCLPFWQNYSLGLSLSFESPKALFSTLIANLLRCGWILSTTGNFTCCIKRKSSILSHDRCYELRPLMAALQFADQQSLKHVWQDMIIYF